MRFTYSIFLPFSLVKLNIADAMQKKLQQIAKVLVTAKQQQKTHTVNQI